MTNSGIRSISTDDLFSLKMIGDPRFSPDGERIAYVVTWMDKEKDDYRSSIYTSTTDGSGSRRMTQADARDTSPRWSPDGRHLAFVSNRTGKGQIWLLRVEGGEAWQASTLLEGVSAFDWSPDGQSFIAVSKTVEGQSEESKDKKKSDVKHIVKIRYKSDAEGFLDGKPRHLWHVPAFGGDAKQLTNADVDDGSPTWSPNGRDIIFVTNRSTEREMNTVSEIWSVTSAGVERPLVQGDTASFHAPSCSPDGSVFAIVGNWHAGGIGPFDDDVWVVPTGGGEPRNITAGFNRSIEDSTGGDMYAPGDARPVWSNDGSEIYVTACDSGETQIYAFKADGSGSRKLTSGAKRHIGVTAGPDGSKLAYIVQTSTSPGDLFVANSDGSAEVRLTNLNDETLAGLKLPEPEEFKTASLSDGAEIQGWILKPPGFDPSRKYPLILQIHGGPHTMYGYGFTHEFQLMAARGYVVLYCNPRGSTGYDEAFTQYTNQRWGETDMPDVMAAVDWAVAQGYVDQNRLGVTGGSYGGYLTNWIIAHTDRFRAAVTQRCVSNLHSFYGTSDIGWFFGESQFGGNAWERREVYMKYSPVSYVANIHTPLLVLHSENDYRTPIEQSEQMFISLKRLGREVEFVRIPDSNHDLSRNGKPSLRIERLNHIIGWFDRYL